MMNYKKSVIAILMALAVLAGSTGLAIAAALNWSAATTITIGTANYTIQSGSAATSMAVSATGITVTVPASSTFTITAPSGYALGNSQSIATTCSSGIVTLAVIGLKTDVVITPTASQSCNVAGQGGTTGGTTVTTTPTPTPTPSPTLTPTSTPAPTSTPTPTPTPTTTTGPTTPAAPSGVTLYRAEGDSRVYVIKDGKKQWIKTAEEFTAAGYKWSDIVVATPSIVSAYPDATVMGITVKIVNTSTLRVRQSNTTQSGILSSVKQNEVFTVIEQKGGWYKIKTSSGVVGWVSGAYTAEQTGATPEIAAGATISITASTLRVRNSGSAIGSVLGAVKRGENYSVIEEKNGWYKIKTAKGITGWVSGAYAEKK